MSPTNEINTPHEKPPEDALGFFRAAASARARSFALASPSFSRYSSRTCFVSGAKRTAAASAAAHAAR